MLRQTKDRTWCRAQGRWRESRRRASTTGFASSTLPRCAFSPQDVRQATMTFDQIQPLGDSVVNGMYRLGLRWPSPTELPRMHAAASTKSRRTRTEERTRTHADSQQREPVRHESRVRELPGWQQRRACCRLVGLHLPSEQRVPLQRRRPGGQPGRSRHWRGTSGSLRWTRVRTKDRTAKQVRS